MGFTCPSLYQITNWTLSIGIPTADGVRSHGKEASKLTADCTSDSGPEKWIIKKNNVKQ